MQLNAVGSASNAKGSARQRAYLGLGSNLQTPQAQVTRAISALNVQPALTVCGVSRLYGSAPQGDPLQPDYVNAVVAVETTQTPEALLQLCQAIEQAQGRVRSGERWGPRTLDIDLLCMGQMVMDTPQLTLPHPRMLTRRFVLQPLADLLPIDYVLSGRPISEWLAAAQGQCWAL